MASELIRYALVEDDLIRLSQLINQIYTNTEAGMWKSSFKRVHPNELRTLVSEKKVIVYTKDDTIVASIMLTANTSDIYEFGMLICSEEHRHQGIASKLIKRSEVIALEAKAKKMQLHILYPKDFTIPTKEVLKSWYVSLGYKYKETKIADSDLGVCFNDLKCSCLISKYEKELKKASY